MSAECDRCGTDLVYGEWPEMRCRPCELENELTGTRESLVKVWLTLRQLVDKLHQVADASEHIFLAAANHGVPYRGPTYGAELKRAEQVLKELKTP